MAGAAISVSGLGHTYRGRSASLTVLADLDLQVEPGGYVAITGPSGAGKSTLLSILGGLDAPQAGTVVVGDHDLHHLRRNQLAD